MKKVIYTAITGNYDTLLEPKWTGDWEFICFTTNPHLKSKHWKIHYVAPENDLIKQARRLKIVPQFKYDICLWVDGNIQIVGNINEFIKPFQNERFALMKHPHRTNIIQEGFAIAKYQKDKIQVIEKQIFDYIKQGYNCSELSATGIVYRNHCDEVKQIAELWCEEVNNHSHRDQMSFDYVCWKLGITPYKLDFIPEAYFQYHVHMQSKQIKPNSAHQKGRGRIVKRR